MAASYHKFEMCWNFALESLAVSAARSHSSARSCYQRSLPTRRFWGQENVALVLDSKLENLQIHDRGADRLLQKMNTLLR